MAGRGTDLKKEILKQVLILAEAFGLPINDARQRIYVDALSDLPLEQIEAAVLNIIKTRTFAGNLPTVAEIRESAGTGHELMETRIAIAWDKLLYALERHGTDETVIFDDPLIHHILKSWGGWIEWGNGLLTKDVKWVRKDFDALYRAYSFAQLGPPPPCIGDCEHQNSLKGYDEFIPPPIYISGKPGAFISKGTSSLWPYKALPRAETPKQIKGDPHAQLS